MSKLKGLASLDTELAFATTRFANSEVGDGKTATDKTTSAFPRTASSAFPKTPLNGLPTRGMLGRRGTTRAFDIGAVDKTEALAYDGGDDVLTTTGSFLYKIHTRSVLTRYCLYTIPVAILLAVPIIITAVPPYNSARADGIRLLGLFIWIEMAWLSVWVAKLIAQAFPLILQAVCGLISTGIRKCSLILKALQTPMAILIWTILCWGSTDMIFVFDQAAYKQHQKGQWVKTLKRTYTAGIVAAAVFVLEKTVIQLISINHYRKQYAGKIRESKRLILLLEMLYQASRILFPDFSRNFEDEDAEIHNKATSGNDAEFKLERKGTNLLTRKLSHNVLKVRNKAATALSAISNNTALEEEFSSGASNSHAVVSKALETESASRALARRLFASLCAEGNDAIYQQDIAEVLGPDREAEAEEIFNMLDRDGNGDVSLEEMTILIVNCGYERRDRASSILDISSAIAVLDKILSGLVVLRKAFILVIALVYALFFSKAFAAKSAQLGTSVASLGFAIGGTVTEFFSCCIFLFVKHPYDVGDRVDIEQEELIVKHISLMFTIFKKVDNDSIVQIPHNIANTLWISNISRSKAMRERITIKVSFGTKTQDLLLLRHEMQTFISLPENRHDFLPEVDIELRSLQDLFALELRIAIRHKSNWANDSLRLYRRNKFMCELFAVMARIPIERPGGNWGPANPTYMCEMSHEEASKVQREKAERRAEADKSAVMEELGGKEGLKPAQVMFPGLKRRHGAAAGEAGAGMGRRPSIWSPL